MPDLKVFKISNFQFCEKTSTYKCNSDCKRVCDGIIVVEHCGAGIAKKPKNYNKICSTMSFCNFLFISFNIPCSNN